MEEFGEDILEGVGEASTVGPRASHARLRGENLRPEERALVEPSRRGFRLHRLEHVRREGALARALHVAAPTASTAAAASSPLPLSAPTAPPSPTTPTAPTA